MNSELKADLETKVREVTGDFIDNFEVRTLGKAKGQARLGSFIDLAVFTRHEDIRVIVICTDFIFQHSTKEQMLKCVHEAAFPGESVKLRVVCAVLSSGHFDIGVLQENDTSRAVFELGDDWDRALDLILTFIKNLSPKTSMTSRARLCPPWRENPEPLDGCACGETSCNCRVVPLKKVTCVTKKPKNQ